MDGLDSRENYSSLINRMLAGVNQKIATWTLLGMMVLADERLLGAATQLVSKSF